MYLHLITNMIVYHAIGRFKDQYLLFWIHSIGFIFRFDIFVSSCPASRYIFRFDGFVLVFV